MLYPKVSKTFRNVGKYSPNETASNPRGLEKSGTALRTSNVARIGLHVTGACVHAVMSVQNMRLQCKLLLSLSHKQTEKWMQCNAESPGHLVEVWQVEAMPSNSREWQEVYWCTFSKSVEPKHKFYSCSEIYNVLHSEIFSEAFISPLWPSVDTAVWNYFLLLSIGNVCDVRILCGMDTLCSSQTCKQKHSCSSDYKGSSDQFFCAELHFHVFIIQTWVHQTNQYTVSTGSSQ
jgi:hypothetical protein